MVKVNDKRFCGIFLNSFKNDVGQFSEERPPNLDRTLSIIFLGLFKPGESRNKFAPT